MANKAGKDNSSTRERRLNYSDDLLWGMHPVSAALDREPERISEIILQKDKRGAKWQEIVELARQKKVKLCFVATLKIRGENDSPVKHQGIVAKMSRTALLPLPQLLDDFQKRIENGEVPRVIACDSLQDPHNLGAIIRSAHASGASAVIVTRENSAPLGGIAAKSSAGAISHISVCQVTNLSKALQQLKEVGAWIFGAVKEESAQSLFHTDLRLPACIVVGSEGKGIRPLVRKQCDVLVSIPMQGELDSLNSSVAAGIILFEALRQNMQGQEK